MNSSVVVGNIQRGSASADAHDELARDPSPATEPPPERAPDTHGDRHGDRGAVCVQLTRDELLRWWWGSLTAAVRVGGPEDDGVVDVVSVSWVRAHVGPRAHARELCRDPPHGAAPIPDVVARAPEARRTAGGRLFQIGRTLIMSRSGAAGGRVISGTMRTPLSAGRGTHAIRWVHPA